MTFAAVARAAARAGDFQLSREIADRIIQHFSNDLALLRHAGIEAFLGGDYPTAEYIWGEWHRRREAARHKEHLQDHEPILLGITWFAAIGHVAHLDTYFKWQHLMNRRRRLAFNLPAESTIPNADLLRRWERYLGSRLVLYSPPSEGQCLELVQDEFWGLPVADGRFRMFSHAGAWVQNEWERLGKKPLLLLSPEDHDRAAPILSRLGVPRGGWYVCLHVREPGFHQSWHSSNPGTRNADVNSYVEAAKAIVSRGGFVIRVGDATMTKFSPIPGVIDYAHSSEKSEFMDIYLSASCRFFIGTNSGLGLVPPVFGVPCALTNWSPIGLPQWYPNDLFIPKLCFDERLGRYLTFEEMFRSGAGWAQFQDYFVKNRIRIEDNHPEDIRELVLEMLDRRNGIVDDEETGRMRAAYQRLACEAGSYSGAQIGGRFLRKYGNRLLRMTEDQITH